MTSRTSRNARDLLVPCLQGGRNENIQSSWKRPSGYHPRLPNAVPFLLSRPFLHLSLQLVYFLLLWWLAQLVEFGRGGLRLHHSEPRVTEWCHRHSSYQRCQPSKILSQRVRLRRAGFLMESSSRNRTPSSISVRCLLQLLLLTCLLRSPATNPLLEPGQQGSFRF